MDHIVSTNTRSLLRNGDLRGLTTKEISNKARENLRSNTELRRRMKRNTLLILRDGKKVVRIFKPAQIAPLESDYEDNDERTRRFAYTVTDPNTDRTEVFHAIDALENDTSMTVTGPSVSMLEILEF